MKLIAQGAEAKIYQSGDKIVKDRISKSYRIKQIDDRLRKTRTKAEAKLLSRASRAGLPVPKVLETGETKLEIELIDGLKLRDILTPEHCKEIGRLLLKLHKEDLVHGDLTTSNMILKEGKIYFIDFGLGQNSRKTEDKAVDIHLFKECLKSKHFEIWQKCWKEFLTGYKNKDVLKRLEIVERRGRYK